jgi:hypothetical protein
LAAVRTPENRAKQQGLVVGNARTIQQKPALPVVRRTTHKVGTGNRVLYLLNGATIQMHRQDVNDRRWISVEDEVAHGEHLLATHLRQPKLMPAYVAGLHAVMVDEQELANPRLGELTSDEATAGAAPHNGDTPTAQDIRLKHAADAVEQVNVLNNDLDLGLNAVDECSDSAANAMQQERGRFLGNTVTQVQTGASGRADVHGLRAL